MCDKLPEVKHSRRTKREIEEAPEKPPRTTVNFDGIPEALKARKQFVLWRWEKSKPDKNGVRRWTKVPYSIKGQKASTTNPKTWAKLSQVRINYEGDPSFDGIGYVFSAEDPFTGIDLDESINLETGAAKPWAASIIEDFQTCTDISPTETGVKLIVGGKKPPGCEDCKKPYHDGEVEIYDRSRFFTITGKNWPGTPVDINHCPDKIAALYDAVFGPPPAPEKPPPEPINPSSSPGDLELLEKARNADDGDKFRRLYDQGDTSEYDGDDSRADMALVCKLAFWTDRDAARIDSLFRNSALMRAKWDEKRGKTTYGKRTIKEALALVTEGYRPGGKARFGKQRHERNGEAASANEHKEFPLGSLILRPGKPRQTPSKIVCPVLAYKDSEVVYPFGISTVDSSRQPVVKQLAAMLPDQQRDTIDRVLLSILAWGVAQLTQQCSTSDGPTVGDIVKEQVPKALRLACRTEKGVWSETRGCELSRSDFLASVGEWLVEAASKASDAPRNEITGEVARLQLLGHLKAEMEILWADLLTTLLPPPAAVDLGKDSERGQEFRRAMIRLFTRIQTWEQVRDGQVVSRSSLISRAKTQYDHWLVGRGAVKWFRAQPAVDCWWRPWTDTEGEIHLLLGIRWPVMEQVGVMLPGVMDQASLTRLGTLFNVIVDPPPVGVPSRTTGGESRIAVLSLGLCGELCETPCEDEFDNPREPGLAG
jgi:hypothetical protein